MPRLPRDKSYADKGLYSLARRFVNAPPAPGEILIARARVRHPLRVVEMCAREFSPRINIKPRRFFIPCACARSPACTHVFPKRDSRARKINREKGERERRCRLRRIRSRRFRRLRRVRALHRGAREAPGSRAPMHHSHPRPGSSLHGGERGRKTVLFAPPRGRYTCVPSMTFIGALRIPIR